VQIKVKYYHFHFAMSYFQGFYTKNLDIRSKTISLNYFITYWIF